MARDDFSKATIETIAKRVGYRCSICGAATTGPHSDQSKTVNIGVAAHITAASPNGPRYDPKLTTQERASPSNAIWLDQKCAKLIDSDTSRYTADQLRSLKEAAEYLAFCQLAQAPAAP